MTISVDENLAKPIFLNIMRPRKHSFHQRSFNFAQDLAACFDLVSAANVEANDLLFVVGCDSALDDLLFFLPGDLIGEDVLFVLFHVSVQLFIVLLGSHVVRQQFLLHSLELSDLLVVNPLESQDLIVEACLKVVNALLKLVLKICLTFEILSGQLLREIWCGDLDIVKATIL